MSENQYLQLPDINSGQAALNGVNAATYSEGNKIAFGGGNGSQKAVLANSENVVQEPLILINPMQIGSKGRARHHTNHHGNPAANINLTPEQTVDGVISVFGNNLTATLPSVQTLMAYLGYQYIPKKGLYVDNLSMAFLEAMFEIQVNCVLAQNFLFNPPAASTIPGHGGQSGYRQISLAGVVAPLAAFGNADITLRGGRVMFFIQVDNNGVPWVDVNLTA